MIIKNLIVLSFACVTVFYTIAAIIFFQSVPSLQLKAENTSKSIEYYRNMGTGSTDDVLFNPIPDETKMADSITPLRQRLDGVKMPRSPKKSQPKYPVRDHNDNHQRRKSLRVRLSKK